jgi:hypothetical protein
LEPSIRDAFGGDLQRVTYAAEVERLVKDLKARRAALKDDPSGPLVPPAFLTTLSLQEWQELVENNGKLDNFQCRRLWLMTGRDPETAPTSVTLLFEAG